LEGKGGEWRDTTAAWGDGEKGRDMGADRQFRMSSKSDRMRKKMGGPLSGCNAFLDAKEEGGNKSPD